MIGWLSHTNEVSLPPVRLQLQATSVGEVVIKGLAANRYLAMNRDGRLFGAVSPESPCSSSSGCSSLTSLGALKVLPSPQIFCLPKYNLLVEL